jgi:hypothetical protein
MKEIPILFSTPMVVAELEDRKTMTRRTRGLEKINGNPSGWYLQTLFLHATGRFTFAPVDPLHAITEADIVEVKCPYGQQGDILWVRETFGIYRDAFLFKAGDIGIFKGIKWKPSIHMPKDYARIWLQVEEIRLERLHDISEEDAMDEGVQCIRRTSGYCWMNYLIGEFVYPSTAKYSFSTLWKKINGNDSNIGWDTNPWVWAVKFKILSTTGKPNNNVITKEQFDRLDPAEKYSLLLHYSPDLDKLLAYNPQTINL